MLTRVAPVLAASLALVAVVACGSSLAPVTSPATAVPPTPVPTVRPAPSATPAATPLVTTPPDAGNVDGGGTAPELTIELVDPTTISAQIADPAAKAWRLVVAGVGSRAGDRWEIVVETGDVGPTILATEIRDGRVADQMDLSGFADGTAAAGGCHATLPVCISSDGFRLPQDGDGTFAVHLTLPEPGTPLTITGGTATWPGEPFVLGPWTNTEAFPWNGQG
jgi:hypothetical protein